MTDSLNAAKRLVEGDPDDQRGAMVHALIALVESVRDLEQTVREGITPR